MPKTRARRYSRDGRLDGSCCSTRSHRFEPDDLGKTVMIRREPHTVVQAVNRQMSHYSAHVGQIVLLAKHFAGPRWQTLSIPKKGQGVRGKG